MGRDYPSRRGSRSSDSGSPVTMILLIIGLVIGIPAIIAVLVFAVIFGLAYIATKKGVEAVDQMAKENQQWVRERAKEAEAERIRQDAIRRQQEKERQDAMKFFPKPPDPFDPWKGKPKEKEIKIVPFLPAPPRVPGTNQIDLIALMDPTKDAVDNRRWEILNKELHCKEGSFVPRIEIPYIPPAEYDFMVTFSQPGLRNGISLIMPNPNGGSFFWFLGSEDGNAYGFEGRPKREFRMKGLIQANKAHTTVVQVRRTGVKAYVDNKEVLNIPTDFRDLNSDNWREIRDTRLLAVACDDPTMFHFVRLIEINGAGQRTR